MARSAVSDAAGMLRIWFEYPYELPQTSDDDLGMLVKTQDSRPVGVLFWRLTVAHTEDLVCPLLDDELLSRPLQLR